MQDVHFRLMCVAQKRLVIIFSKEPTLPEGVLQWDPVFTFCQTFLIELIASVCLTVMTFLTRASPNLYG